MYFYINDTCVCCAGCAMDCPAEAITRKGDRYVIHQDMCIHCRCRADGKGKGLGYERIKCLCTKSFLVVNGMEYYMVFVLWRTFSIIAIDK